MLVQVAKALAGSDQHTERGIDLWMEHIGPVWKKDFVWMKQALVKWCGAMQAEGLAPQGTNEMDQFIHHGAQKKEINFGFHAPRPAVLCLLACAFEPRRSR